MDRAGQSINLPAPRCHLPSRRERFFAGNTWLILRNILGWALIIASLVAGPLVPGPGGIPLFLIGFALVSFPGKRRLTTRALCGRPLRPRWRAYALWSLAIALPLTIVLVWVPIAPRWLAGARDGALTGGAAWALAFHAAVCLALWGLIMLMPWVANLVLRVAARARRTVRPWLRRYYIRLLPPRWRLRRAHERGSGPLKLKDEILKLSRLARR